jgi:exocyst complex component 2
MALEIIKLFTSSVSQFFTLSDLAVAQSAANKNSQSQAAPPPFVPLNSNSVVSGHFAVKIVAEVADAVAELQAMDISPEAGSALRGMMESLRWRFEEALCTTWSRGELGTFRREQG